MTTVEKIELEILYEISRLANSLPNLKERLNTIVEITAEKMQKDACSLFLIDKDRQSLILEAAKGLNPGAVERVRLLIGEGISGWVAKERSPLALTDPQSDPRFKFIPETGVEHYRAMLSVPIIFEETLIGVLNLHSLPLWSPNPEEITLLCTIANEVGGIIRNAQLYQDINQRLTELTAINEVGQALTSTLDLDTLLQMIIKSSVMILKARGGFLRILDSKDDRLIIRSFFGPEDVMQQTHLLGFDEEMGKRIVKEGVLLLPQLREELQKYHRFDTLPFSSLLGVPLKSKNKVVGTLTLYDKIGKTDQQLSPFSRDDLRLLSTLASQASIAVENAIVCEELQRLAEENEKKMISLSVLYDISRAMQTTLELEKLLQIILTGATMGGGLGFNRAALFLVNEKENTLEGTLAVGPDTAEEAGLIWQRLAQVKGLAEWIITEEELREPRECRLNNLVKRLKIPLAENEGILALTALQRRPFNIKNSTNDPRITAVCREVFGAADFATVPLISKDKVIGVIAVDNLYNQKAITDEDLHFLFMFANQAGQAIENAMTHTHLEEANQELRKIQERLIHTEKMAALGEMATSITHEIRNPLVSVGGFARRLRDRLRDNPSLGKYAEIICLEADRLEKILQEILIFSKESVLHCAPADINVIILEALDLLQEILTAKEIHVETQLATQTVTAEFDPLQMKQVMINLFTNAEEAMERGGRLKVTTAQVTTPDPKIRIEIEDTGPGIPPDAMANIFNPFFTTKSTGTGIGLAIVHRIITSHRGTIEVKNKPEGGASFVICLPCHKEEPSSPGPPVKIEAKRTGPHIESDPMSASP